VQNFQQPAPSSKFQENSPAACSACSAHNFDKRIFREDKKICTSEARIQFHMATKHKIKVRLE
jgi:hypothetical protein